MRVTEITTAAPSEAVAKSFLDALGRRDFGKVSSLFAPNVWFRALLPRKRYEHSTRDDAVAALQSWYGGAVTWRVLETDHHTLAGREFVRYRFQLLPEWAPEQWHVIEQVGFLRAKEGSITRLDLVCTGFFPQEDLCTVH